MSAPAPPAQSPHTPVVSEDGLGIADLLDLLGLEPSTDVPDEERAAATRPAGPVAVVRSWVRRAVNWGSGPERSWCAW